MSSLFIMLKKCSNACTLRYAGTDFNAATHEAYQISNRMRIATYVLNFEQVKTIFGQYQNNELHEWMQSGFKSELALELPLNFKKHLH